MEGDGVLEEIDAIDLDNFYAEYGEEFYEDYVHMKRPNYWDSNIAPYSRDAFNYLFNTCAFPVLLSTFMSLLPLFAYNYSFATIVPSYVMHKRPAVQMCGLVGIMCLVSVLGFEETARTFTFLYLLAFFVHWSFNQNIMRPHEFILTFGTLYMFIREYSLPPAVWSRVRGIEMLFIMKGISISYDYEYTSTRFVPKGVELMSYFLYPGSVIFGPWMSHAEFKSRVVFCCPKSRFRPKISWTIVYHVVKMLVLAFIYLAVSTCFSYWIFSRVKTPILVAWRDALMVRCSHYFISTLSELMCYMAGYRGLRDEPIISVANPLKIEFPRSMSSVVIHWNYQMHRFLKSYIYKPYIKNGTTIAILFTFAVSAGIHGLNFRLSVILFSLGFYIVGENEVRESLSFRLNSCLRSRPCPSPCPLHRNPHGQLFTHVINLLFSLLTIMSLSYFGSVLYDDEVRAGDEEDTLPLLWLFYYRILKRWEDLHFFPHVMTMFFYAISSNL